MTNILKSEREILNEAYDGTSYLVASSLLDAYGTNNIDEATATLTYVGKEDQKGNWLIQKIDTSSGTAITYATRNNNSSYSIYASAWTNRASLTYGSFNEAF